MDAVAPNSAAANVNSPPPFLSKTYDMVDGPSTNSVVSWSDNGNSFVVWNVPEFARDILPKGKENSRTKLGEEIDHGIEPGEHLDEGPRISTFVYIYHGASALSLSALLATALCQTPSLGMLYFGFRKVDPDRWEFANEGFLRGQKHLLKSISRRKPAQLNGNQQPSLVQNSPAGAFIEVGKFGLEEEVERLQRDKNVLMQELVRLRQQQQATDNQLQSVGQRVQVMEQRQQQMMSFLAKAMQSPGFLAQFVQQQSDSNRHIIGGNKKRRLHRQEEDTLASEHLHNSLDGRFVKFQPSMNEAAKALLRQILQMNASGRMASSLNNPDAFLIDNVPSAIALDSRSSSSRASGVTLSEVPPPTSGHSYMAAVQSQFPINCVPNSIPEMQSSSAVLTDAVKAAEFPELNLHNCPESVLDFGKVQGVERESSLLNPELSFAEPDAGDIDMMSAVLDGTQPVEIEADAFSPDPDGISKLPSISDVFWEQFLTASPLTGDTDEISSCAIGDGLTEDQESPSEKESGGGDMDKIKHMDHITQQLGLLASESS
ncbi:heat stress transcription factor A-1b-like [Senna tora]|uniref:Heat stress transcription factor A-1b-like n=1 Tax=Senna tora TaxID=362788 RepID=A0A834X1M7_9FABA|nr:heat stress transcription factor A-1b-like [Senna tora]